MYLNLVTISPMPRLGQLNSVNNFVRIVFQVIYCQIQFHIWESAVTFKLNHKMSDTAILHSHDELWSLKFGSKSEEPADKQ